MSVTFFYGNSGAGKTTIARRYLRPGEILLDGDKLRKVWKLGFSKEDRWENNMRAARLAFMLEDQGFDVIVAMICPYRKLREEIKKLGKVKFVYIEGGQEPSEKYPFEI